MENLNRMIDTTSFLPDKYSVRARIVPVVLCLFPWLVYLPVKVSLHVLNWWFGPLLAIALLLVAEHFGRLSGKKREAKLFASWGGVPSVAMLRHRDKRIDSTTKRRYHRFLQKAIPDLCVPTPEEEARQPELADHSYSAACSWLREQTRNKEEFHLLAEENCGYGFRRNTWGLKPVTIAFDLLLVVPHITSLVLTLLELQWMKFVPTTHLESIAITSLVLPHLLIVILTTNPNWIKIQAETYARQLLSSCDALRKTNGSIPV